MLEFPYPILIMILGPIVVREFFEIDNLETYLKACVALVKEL
jgi:hypothetical protein